MDGLVSKLSARLQQAALSNSLLPTTEVLAVVVSDFRIPFFTASTFTSSNFVWEKFTAETNNIRNIVIFFIFE
jgi:hypothetical protein